MRAKGVCACQCTRYSFDAIVDIFKAKKRQIQL